jgi:hypothetical protein
LGTGLSKIQLLDQTTMPNSLLQKFKSSSPRAALFAVGLAFAISASAQTPSAALPKLHTSAEAATLESGEQLLQNPARPTLKRLQKAESLLIGTWRSVESNADKAPTGSIFFQPNGAILIAPDGFRPLVGKWEADAQNVRFTTPEQGDALIGYSFSKDHKQLTLHFENQLVQKFFRQPTKKSSKP